MPHPRSTTRSGSSVVGVRTCPCAIASEIPGVSGVYWPGQDWYNALPFIWENGGEIAVLDGDQWDAQLSSPESLAGLEQVGESSTSQ